MPGPLAGKTAIVTGGGRNIGRAIALRFAAEGARVAVLGRTREALEQTARIAHSSGADVLVLPADVTDRAQVEAAVSAVESTLGPVDVLAAIAGGGGGYEEVDRIDPSWWEHVLRINVVGTFLSVRSVVTGMRERGVGSIVTCTGGGAFFPLTDVPATAYATSKAAVCRFTDQLAVELLESGVRVNCLQPGQTWSDERLAEVAAEEARTWAEHPQRATNHPPEDAAELALWLASDASAPLTGRTVSVDDDWWRDRERVSAVCASLHAYTLRRVEGA